MIFTPRHVKEGRHYRHALRRLINYRRDVLTPEQLATLQGLVDKMSQALRERKREGIGKVQEEIDRAVGKIAPPPKDAAWRENVEVLLVAVVVAAGVRAYFLQPFKIPTGSMQPTLYGIVGVRTESGPPNLLVRAAQMVWLGRHYIDLKATADDQIVEIREATYANFFTFTEIVGQRTKYRLFAPRDTLRQYFGVVEGRRYAKGDVIARGYIDTGDQVFVDKMSYHFHPPRLGDVFVFKTTGIHGIQRTLPPGVDSQHYIKRLAGLPGQTLRIDPPNLYIDGKLADLPAFRKVMSCQNGYRGYSDTVGIYLREPDAEFLIPKRTYFALGDNSYNSRDSRDWGVVPQDNIGGRGFIVFWPFSSRWGLIH